MYLARTIYVYTPEIVSLKCMKIYKMHDKLYLNPNCSRILFIIYIH